jgi:tRNA(Ile)-lysidine synthase TilS/MesJ
MRTEPRCNRRTGGHTSAQIDGWHVIASISGGKDSVAMSLYLRELEVEHVRVFCDTGWEHRDSTGKKRAAGPVTPGP